MKNLKFYTNALFVLLAVVAEAQAQTAEISPMSGGAFTMTQSVISGGGGETGQDSLTGHAAIGQPFAGVFSTGEQFQHYSGFWLPNQITQSASAVIGGRIVSAAGRGIRNVRVTITFPGGETRTVVSGGGGFYRFTDIPTGENYVVSIEAKKHFFSQNARQTQVVKGDASDLDFTSDAVD